MDKAELRGLWDKYQAAKRNYEHLAMTNTAGQASDALFELDLAYRAAMRRMMRAEDAFAAAARKLAP